MSINKKYNTNKSRYEVAGMVYKWVSVWIFAWRAGADWMSNPIVIFIYETYARNDLTKGNNAAAMCEVRGCEMAWASKTSLSTLSHAS